MMSKSILDVPPSGLLRAALRLPIWLYRAGLGWLLGDRFLMLTHTGRKSGRKHETVIEVVKHEPGTGTYYVVSGWGSKSDWYLNVRKNPLVSLQIGTKHVRARAEAVPAMEAADILEEYSRRYPGAFAELTRLVLGERLQPGPEAGHKLADRMPMVAFRPVQAREAHR